MLLRISAPHFVAGIVPRYKAAPILAWMLKRDWNEAEIRAYCLRKRWQVEKLPPRWREHV